MAYDYDKLYGTTPDALGNPTDVFVNIFQSFTKTPLNVLDVGCGQGRDALFIARLGHRVTGIDQSQNGIRDLERAAAFENLTITGLVTDITDFETDDTYDVVLIDRTLHMLPTENQTSVLRNLLKTVRVGGYVLIADEKSNVPAMIAEFEADTHDWELFKNDRGYLFYRRSNVD